MMNKSVNWMSAIGLLMMLWLPASLYAAGAAIVMNTSGIVSAQRPDGSVRALSKNSPVEVGETISTEKGSYARFKFTDGGELTLQPDTKVTINQYGFDEAKPDEDNFVFSLVKGGLRSVTGLVGKRGNRDAYKLNTATATIGIRGTDYRAAFCSNNCGKISNGLYLNVVSGIINASNNGGSLDYSAGSYGHIPDVNTPPVILPAPPKVPNLGDDGDDGEDKGGCINAG